MEILLVAATTVEIQPTTDYLRTRKPRAGGLSVTPLITGVGGLATTWALTRQLERNRPGLVLQAGIAGCFTDKKPGEVLAVSEEILGDLGVWEDGRFRSLFEMQLADPNDFPFVDGGLPNPNDKLQAFSALETVRGITVNEISTNAEKISWHQQYTAAVVESMEGGALHYVCLQSQLPFLQLRSISNSVGVRDKTKWDIRLAISRLNEELIGLLERLETSFESNPFKS